MELNGQLAQDPDGFSHIHMADHGDKIAVNIQLHGGGVLFFVAKNARAPEIILGLRKAAARLEKIAIKNDLSRN